MKTNYAIKHSHGQTDTGYETYEAACEAVHSVYGSIAIGHDGDISQGGESTLCWIDAATADDDDGSRACCKILARHEIRDNDAVETAGDLADAREDDDERLRVSGGRPGYPVQEPE